MTTWHDQMYEEGIVYYITGIFFNIFTSPFISYPLFFIICVVIFFVLLVLLINSPIIWFTIKEKTSYLKALAYYYIIPKLNFIKYNFVELKSNYKRYGWRQWLIIGLVLLVLAGLVTFGLINFIQILNETPQNLINETESVINNLNTTLINN